MPDEIELRLVADEDGLAALAASGLVPKGTRARTLSAICFDTPDRALRKAGLSLCVRRSGNGRIQTITSSTARGAGLFAWQAWDTAVRDDRPVLDGDTPLNTLSRKKLARLAPVFTVKVRRRTVLLSGLELSVDTGEVVAEGRRAPVREIELQLKSGEVAEIFALARRIADVVPVRLGTSTKSEAGYHLLTGPAVACRSEPVGLTPGLTAAQAFRQIGFACLRHYRLNEDLLLTARQPEALHQARVALRRLRSALSIFRPIIAPGTADRLREELRDLAAVLGHARDLDVLIARSGDLSARLEGPREDAYGRVAEALSSDRSRRLMLDLAEWLTVGDWLAAPATAEARGRPIAGFAAKALSRLRRKLRKQGADLAEATDEVRHEVRKDAKKLRYAVEFFAPLYVGRKAVRRHGRFLVALERLQDRLGVLNDLAATPILLQDLGMTDLPQAKELLAAGRRKSLIRSAAKAHDAIADAPKFWS